MLRHGPRSNGPVHDLHATNVVYMRGHVGERTWVATRGTAATEQAAGGVAVQRCTCRERCSPRPLPRVAEPSVSHGSPSKPNDHHSPFNKYGTLEKNTILRCKG